MPTPRAIGVVLALLGAALCLCPAHGAEDEPAAHPQLYLQGLTAFGQGLYDAAATSFADYIAACPTRKEAREAALLLAESNVHLGRYAEAAKALDWLEESRWARRSEADVAYWRAQLLLRTGRADEALAAFTAFLNDYPQHERAAYARLGLGQAHLARSEFDEALAAFDAVIAAKPAAGTEKPTQPEAVFLAALGKGRCLIRQGKLDEARALVLGAMDKLEARAHLRGEAFLVLGEASYRARKYAEALEYYKKAFVEDRIYSWYPEALYGIAWCRIDLGQYETARQVLTALAKDYPDDAVAPRVALATAKLDMLEAHHPDAVERLRALIASGAPAPVIEEASYLLADALLAAGKLDEAAAQYEAFLAASPQSAFVPKAKYGLAMARLQSGRRAEAFALLEAVVEAGDPPLVEQALRRLAEQRFADARAGARGDYERAAGHWRALLERFPAVADADRLLFQIAWCYYKMADYDTAVALFKQLLEKYPKSDLADDAQYRIGGALYRQGKYDKALEAYEAFTKRFPESDLADRVAYQTGVCRYNLGDYYPALLAYRTVVEKYPTSPLVHRAAYEIGWCLTMLGKGDEAFKHFADYITRYPDSTLTPEVLFWLGEHQYNRANYDKALERFEQVAADFPKHKLADAALYWAGRACLNLGRHEAAREHFARLMANYPQSDFASDARFQTAVSLIEQGRHAEALETLAPLQGEGGARYLDDKVQWRTADCHLALGRIAEARAIYQPLVESARDETVRAWAQYGLGRCHEAEGDHDRAIAEFMGVATDYPVEREVVGRAMVEAGGCYEALGKRNEALIVYASVVRKDLPGKAEAEARMKKLRKRSFLFFRQD
jgi:TolA-binding protein